MPVRIAVLGAGVVGLSSALCVQDRVPNARVDVIADRFTIHTTSHGAGGIFLPHAEGNSAGDIDRWSRESRQYFFSLARSPDSSTSGVNFMSGLELSTTGEAPPWSKYMIDFREAPEELFKTFEKYYKKGFMFSTVIIEGGKYLPWLTEKFTSKGGVIIKRKIESFEELVGDYDLVINCTGGGASALASDPNIQPHRGQIIRVKAPWIKIFIHSNDRKYILPAAEHVGVGGTYQKGHTDLAPDTEDSRRIWKDMVDRFPPLNNAEVMWEWVGIRPVRLGGVRLETEVVTAKGKQLKVIHNYGHGANGVSLSWGTGQRVAELAQAVLNIPARL